MQIVGRDGNGEFEAGDLGKGMDASVGAARALGKDGLSGDLVNGGGDGALDGGEVGLHLPAVEWCAVVREGEFPEGHALWDGNTRQTLPPGQTLLTQRCQQALSTVAFSSSASGFH